MEVSQVKTLITIAIVSVFALIVATGAMGAFSVCVGAC